VIIVAAIVLFFVMTPSQSQQQGAVNGNINASNTQQQIPPSQIPPDQAPSANISSSTNGNGIPPGNASGTPPSGGQNQNPASINQ